MFIEPVDIYNLNDYAKHLKALPEQDKIYRFGYKINDYSIDQLMLQIAYNPEDHKLWIAKNLDGQIVGWGHMAQEANAWELAVSVNRDYQNNGIGSKLIFEMLEWAKFHDVQEVFMHCIEDNRPIQHLAKKYGLKTRTRGAGERTAALEIPEPSFFEANKQLWKEHSAILNDYAELRRRLTELWFGKTM